MSDVITTLLDIKSAKQQAPDLSRLRHAGLFATRAGAALCLFSPSSGPFGGLGVTYKITDSYTVGAEVLHHKIDDAGDVGGNDIHATTFTLRGSLRFSSRQVLVTEQGGCC